MFDYGNRVRVKGGPSDTGRVVAIQAVAERFRAFAYKVEFGPRITATTGWIKDTLVEKAPVPGSERRRLLFKLSAHAFVDMGDFSITHSADGNLVYDTDPHTRECNLFTARGVYANALRNLAWPDRCPKCDGVGQFHSPGNHDEPDDDYPCPVCSEAGLCPRCGLSVLGDDYYHGTLFSKDEEDRINNWLENALPCPHCGFYLGMDDPIYEVGDCGCYDRNDPYDYDRQEPEVEISKQALYAWIRKNMDLSKLEDNDGKNE